LGTSPGVRLFTLRSRAKAPTRPATEARWYGLADEALEDALYDSQALRDFVGVDFPGSRCPTPRRCSSSATCCSTTTWRERCSRRSTPTSPTRARSCERARWSMPEASSSTTDLLRTPFASGTRPTARRRSLITGSLEQCFTVGLSNSLTVLACRSTVFLLAGDRL